MLERSANQAGRWYVRAERPHLDRREQTPGAVVDRGPVQTARKIEQEPHRDEQTEITDAIGDERLLAGGRVLVVFEPEADQEITAQTDAFPAHEQHRQAVPEDQ